MSINISSYWLNLFYTSSLYIAKALIEGLKSEVVIQNENAKNIIQKWFLYLMKML